MQCQKQFSITVSSGCPDWDSLNWDVTEAYGPLSTINANGRLVTMHLEGAVPPYPEKFSLLHGELDYTGPGCNCAVHGNNGLGVQRHHEHR